MLPALLMTSNRLTCRSLRFIIRNGAGRFFLRKFDLNLAGIFCEIEIGGGQMGAVKDCSNSFNCIGDVKRSPLVKELET
jgi:hypothetical protein